jgi:hypothetical protein
MIALILSLTRAYGLVLKILKLFGEVLNSHLVVLIIGLKLVALLLMRTTSLKIDIFFMYDKMKIGAYINFLKKKSRIKEIFKSLYKK